MEGQSTAKNLIYQRTLKGLTQDKLAEESKVTKRTIQRIEKGDVEPQLQTVTMLATALGIEVDDLLIIDNPKEETLQKKWLLFIHGSPLLGFIFPFSVLFPLFLWLHKREDNPLYNSHGIKVINFQLTMTLVFILAFIALLTIEGWGFLFFIIVVPLNIAIIVYNVFKAVTAQKCFYPLSIPFLKNGSQKHDNKRALLFFLFVGAALVGCSNKTEKSHLETLQEYEGNYEYVGGQEIQMVASPMDTTLYAILDHAKYPMTYIETDVFRDVQDSLVTFKRKGSKVVGYRVEGQDYKLKSKDFDKLEMVPRQELLHNPEGYVHRLPVEKKDGLQTGSLDNEFEKPELLFDMVKETIKGNYPDVHSILIYKNGKLVLEEYFYGYDENTPHQLRSATKAFIGGIVGLAVDKGFIKSEDEKLLPFFHSRYPEIAHLDDRKKEITIENFLTYKHGLDCENNNPESEGNEMRMMQSKDWVKHTLDLPMVTEPGEYSSYCSGCPLTLGSLVEIAANQHIEAFAKANLFEPMGISNYNWTFEPNPESTTTFNQMYLTPRDLVKLAKMYKDGGMFNGNRILSQKWVDKTFETEKGGYGYFWEHKYFMVDGKQYDSYMASGNGGQKINIWPELDMITVFTGGNYNSYLLYGKSTPPNEMIPKYILRAL